MKDKTTKEHTAANPDLEGFDLKAMEGLGAYSDGSGGGVRQLAWEMAKLRELRERMALLDAFIRKHYVLLAKLNWRCDPDVRHPWKLYEDSKDIHELAAQIELCNHAYNKSRHVTAVEIAKAWPKATWRRVMPMWGDSDTERDYVTELDGVVIRIKEAETKPKPKKVDAFGGCGVLNLNALG